MGWGGHQEWRFGHVTLEVPVRRYPHGNNVSSRVFESEIQGKG